MAQVEFDVLYSETRNRGTVAIRLILAIPHLILVGAWTYAVEIVAVIHWFIQVFTGRRNASLSGFTNKWLAYASRVYGHVGLLFDEYPGFIDDDGKTPARYQFVPEETPVNRLTTGLRLIWAIPAAIVVYVMTIVATVLAIVTWFTIVITGKQPRGQFDFLLKVERYVLQFYAYAMLLTDDYPKWGRGAITTTTPGAPLSPPAATASPVG